MGPDHPVFFFFFNDTATTEIYTLSLHDALPIYERAVNRILDDLAAAAQPKWMEVVGDFNIRGGIKSVVTRSEEHTSELQSQSKLVCRLLLEKKKKSTKSAL